MQHHVICPCCQGVGGAMKLAKGPTKRLRAGALHRAKSGSMGSGPAPVGQSAPTMAGSHGARIARDDGNPVPGVTISLPARVLACDLPWALTRRAPGVMVGRGAT